MDWKLYDQDGSFLQEVNCEYDASDLAQWDHQAVELLLDFEKNEAHIMKKEEVNN